MSHEIEIAVDHTESDQFASWLKLQGHNARVGNTTGNYVDGQLTDNDESADRTLNELWTAYCNRQ